MFKCPHAGIARQFKAIFGWQIMNYFDPFYGFDITKFDDALKEQYGDYEDGTTRLKDFVKDKFGANAVGIIEKLIYGIE